MIGLDTNILARYYIEDQGDEEAAKQRTAAHRLMESGQPLKVCKTVLLELEWVMRGYYSFSRADIAAVWRHLLALPQLTLEDREVVLRALASYEVGFDLADALHHASYQDCETMASFDDRKFARRARRMGLLPTVMIPP